LFATWAAVDAEAAAGELKLISPPAQRREIALAMLRVVGNDEEGIELVAAALPEADRASFEIDALLDRVANDPARALDAYFAAPDELHRQVMLPRVAELAVRGDPRAALAMASSIDDITMRRAFTDAVATAWATQDPDAVFAWLGSVDVSELPMSQTVYQALAAGNASRLYSLLDTLPTPIRTTAQRAAMEGLAAADPVSAIAMLNSIPAGPERDRMTQTIAQTYARLNPELAIAWAHSLPPAEVQGAMMGVLSGIATTDPVRAVDLLVAELANAAPARPNPVSSLDALMATTTSSSALSVLLNISSAVTASGGDFGPIADRLLAANNPQIASAFSSTIGTWARQDADAAMSWTLRNADRLEDTAFRSIAMSMALTDVDGAVAMLDRLPADARAGWVEGLVTPLARNDPQRLMSLLEGIRGQPGYEDVYSRAARSIATTDPAVAATLLRNMPTSSTASNSAAMNLVVGRLARSDPAAAIDLARSISDPTARGFATSQIAGAWAESDPAAAQQWLLSLASGPERDLALDNYLTTTTRSNRFDPRLLDAYSSPAARERAAVRAIEQIGRTNLPEARRLLDLYVTDATLRRMAETNLARTGGIGGSGAVLPTLPPITVQ
jgi:hypothetical protein